MKIGPDNSDSAIAREEEEVLSSDPGGRVGVEVDQLADLFLMDGLKGFGPQKFKRLWEARVSPREVLEEAERLPIAGRSGERLRALIGELGAEEAQLARRRAVRQIARALENDSQILTYESIDYPRAVLESNNPVPVLYLRNSTQTLRGRAVACVGSRAIRSPYDERHRAFCARAAEEGLVIVSGFATGADRIGHEAALAAQGRTTLVMPSGLDRPFPPENRDLWHRFLDYDGAAVISEFPFGTAASALTLRKRNKLIVALSAAVLVSQSSEKGGAMNAYRFAIEQKKPVATFASDKEPDTGGNALIERAEGWGGARSQRLDFSDAPPEQPPVTVFASANDDPPMWAEWLQRL